MEDNFKSGLVCLAGPTNVGKSTLLNQIMQTELAITSYKPQTTRHLIKAIYQDDECQIIFIDSPGIHKADDRLGQVMQKSASLAIKEADLVLVLVDARKSFQEARLEKRVIRQAKVAGTPMILVVNKIDLVAKNSLLPLLAAYRDYANFEALVPISAKTSDGLGLLMDEIKSYLPCGPLLVTDDSYTDQTEKVLAAEYIRQEIILQVSDEIPYGVAIKIDDFEEIYGPKGERCRVKIHASIFCEKDSHKGILLGKKGRKIAAVGKAARQNIAEMLDCPCDLMLFVKVRDNWRNNLNQLKELGYSKQDI